MGEILSAAGLLRRLREDLPGAPLYVSCGTVAGRAIAEEKLARIADGVFYAPLDFRFAVRSVLRRIRPQIVVVMETEIWPNLYREAKRSGCGLVVVNGRISDKAIGRYRALAWFFRHALAWPDAILAQTEVSAERYRMLGAPSGRVSVAGNLKYDFDPRSGAVPEAVAATLRATGAEQVWIAASTMPPAHAGDVDEDDLVIEAWASVSRQFPRSLLLLVPRKPERFDPAAEKLERSGTPFVRRSALPAGGIRLALPSVLLVDTIGELSSLYQVADLVFMGGTVAHRGGHNILEPAAFGKIVIVGPHMENFPEIGAEFHAGGAVARIDDGAGLAAEVIRLLGGTKARREIGERARALAESKRGVTGRVAERLSRLYEEAVPSRTRNGLVGAVTCPLARLWSAGSRLKLARDARDARRLATPVISVGGLAMGGVGKTPFVLYLARRLGEIGCRPAILTRGYRRRSQERVSVYPAGAVAPADETGDEAQIFLRSGAAPVGIGAERYDAGRELESRMCPGLFLLDDGFQHRRLHRDLDIVLIDVQDPWAGGDLFPRGRLREPIEALARAHVLVLTRSESWRSYTGIEGRLRALNPGAEILHAEFCPESWLRLEDGDAAGVSELAGKPVAAFCGLANPGGFWRTLEQLGCRPVYRRSFADHHRYSAREIDALARAATDAGAGILVTTEKDAMNLPADTAGRLAPLKLRWLRIGLRVAGEDRLIEAIRARLGFSAGSAAQGREGSA